jgi:hypothetical protein
MAGDGGSALKDVNLSWRELTRRAAVVERGELRLGEGAPDEGGVSATRGLALMEAAATPGRHGDPATAARTLIELLDQWDPFGDVSHPWSPCATPLDYWPGWAPTPTGSHCTMRWLGAGHETPFSTAQLARLGAVHGNTP